MELFPSARALNCTWTNVVKVAESLYREGPGLDQYRPDQRTPIPNFFMAGSYTYQVRFTVHQAGEWGVYYDGVVKSMVCVPFLDRECLRLRCVCTTFTKLQAVECQRSGMERM